MSLPLRPDTLDSDRAPSPLEIDDSGLSPEVYRQLFVSLDLDLDRHPVIGITSAIGGEGRTTVALGLASTLADDLDSLVSLVEVDLEHPTLAQRFGLGTSPGFAEVLRGEQRLPDVRCVAAPNLCVITAGAQEANQEALLRQLPLNDPFHGPHGLHGVVILDLPPLLGYGYSSEAARVADVTLLVVRGGVTPVEIIRDAVSRLGDKPPRGVVFNGARSDLPSWWPGRGL